MQDLARPHLSNTAPVTTLRGWLDDLAARDRLAVVRPGVDLRYELAAISKRLDGEKATLRHLIENYRRPTANSGRWASRPCGIGSA